MQLDLAGAVGSADARRLRSENDEPCSSYHFARSDIPAANSPLGLSMSISAAACRFGCAMTKRALLEDTQPHVWGEILNPGRLARIYCEIKR